MCVCMRGILFAFQCVPRKSSSQLLSRRVTRAEKGRERVKKVMLIFIVYDITAYLGSFSHSPSLSCFSWRCIEQPTHFSKQSKVLKKKHFSKYIIVCASVTIFGNEDNNTEPQQQYPNALCQQPKQRNTERRGGTYIPGHAQTRRNDWVNGKR